MIKINQIQLYKKYFYIVKNSVESGILVEAKIDNIDKLESDITVVLKNESGELITLKYYDLYLTKNKSYDQLIRPIFRDKYPELKLAYRNIKNNWTNTIELIGMDLLHIMDDTWKIVGVPYDNNGQTIKSIKKMKSIKTDMFVSITIISSNNISIIIGNYGVKCNEFLSNNCNMSGIITAVK